MTFSAVQAAMQARGIAAWLVHDFRGSNPIFSRLLPHPDNRRRSTTRRVELFIPARGRATLMVNPLDAGQFEPPHIAPDIDLDRRPFIAWRDLHEGLRNLLAAAEAGGAGVGGGGPVAMEYSPLGALPVVSMVDAGTVELVRSMGVEITSSADLVQVSIARWSDRAVQQHGRDSLLVDGIKDEAFDMIRRGLAGGAGTVNTERSVQAFIQRRFAESSLEFPDGPIVAVNAHAGDPHFEPSATHPSPITRGDWVLIDLWARAGKATGAGAPVERDEELIYSDITWTGFCGRRNECPPRMLEVFSAVRDARDAALRLAQSSWAAGRPVQGWQLDDAARGVLASRGLGEALRHRTGHSLSPGPMVHGLGMNLDNLETHDTRAMLPGIGFTIEPGAYLPDEPVRGPLGERRGFGVRNEINVFVDPQRGPIVTSRSQDEPIWCA